MKNFFKTVAIVTVFSVSEKFLGFIYRIFLSHKIGAEGVGLYSASLSLFGFLFTLVSSGIPITVSRLMTKYKAEGNKLKVQKVITAGLTLLLGISIPVTRCAKTATATRCWDISISRNWLPRSGRIRNGQNYATLCVL